MIGKAGDGAADAGKRQSIAIYSKTIGILQSVKVLGFVILLTSKTIIYAILLSIIYIGVPLYTGWPTDCHPSRLPRYRARALWAWRNVPLPLLVLPPCHFTPILW